MASSDIKIKVYKFTYNHENERFKLEERVAYRAKATIYGNQIIADRKPTGREAVKELLSLMSRENSQLVTDDPDTVIGRSR